MRPTLIAVISFTSGCAQVPRPQVGCVSLAYVGRGQRADYRVYRAGQRVPDDDLPLATADSAVANQLAEDARRDQRAGLGAFLAGGLVFAPSLGLLGWGIDQHQVAAVASTAPLVAVGVAGLLTGVALVGRASQRSESAVAAYNLEHAAGCRPY
jgi:hypothetical protein